ncbi:hypothetical protein HANVADRAFT_51061 [Hanseniaspora valbyensis NRRL Y-1626]|uniref:Guanine nucleotide-binding protein subunit gamma n=1 Tax=Hanseniaspora valbyensis NRRL Y-1626 TaxID=766949 RepID=A0A1B7TK58_9ASCO|nr:hypothetical protein HANVADRAFT_51061 [Hanseniaspora valbyensis NRRL Y-1626]
MEGSVQQQKQTYAAINSNNNLQLKYKINYLKLKRINELNQNLKKELLRERITSSNASLQIINYTNDLFQGKDYTVPSLYGYPAPGINPLNTKKQPFSQQNISSSNNANAMDQGCCAIM